MKILYISELASQAALKDAHAKAPKLIHHAIQKFSRLIAEGFAINGHEVQALSVFFLPGIGYSYRRKSEYESGVLYRFIPSPNYRYLRIIWIILFVFFYILIWGIKNKKDKVVFCDVLKVSACTGALMAARLIGIRCVGLMTDMPGLGVENSFGNDGYGQTPIAAKINKLYLKQFTHYVFITEQMNNVVNVKHRPYIVMEGLIDSKVISTPSKKKYSKRIVIYAGGLYERYGLKLLVEGFIKADIEDSELWLYGNGPFVKELNNYQKQDSRIKYKGILPNEEVVEAESQATLLVNPRPSNEKFTLYSFPSKNLEYMASGTPLLTTCLPGMPKEYYPYIYIFNQGETVDGYAAVLRKVLSLPRTELNIKGKNAKLWIEKNKNQLDQTKRIIELLKIQ